MLMASSIELLGVKSVKHRLYVRMMSSILAVSCSVNCLHSTIGVDAATVTIVDGLPTLNTPRSLDTPTQTPKLSLDFSVVSKNNTVSDEENNLEIYRGSSTLTGGISYEGVTITADERRWIANVVQHEVGSYKDSFDGNPNNCPRINVACSVLNRYATDYWEFPNSIKEVILQPHAYTGISGFWDRTGYADEDSFKAVDYALENGDITGGCYWFRNKAITGYNSFFDGATTIKWMFQDSAGHEYYKLKD